jgi:two-component system NtrC family sensor kinase
LAGILERRQSIHQDLRGQQKLNDNLRIQIDQIQPLVNLGLVSAMIAHEINNILTPLGNYAQLSLNNPDDIELAHKANSKTVKNSERATKILQAMLAMANGQRHQKTESPVKAMVEEIFVCLARDFGKDGIKVTIDIDDDLKALVDRICFQQVLMNLILNAREAFFASLEPGQRPRNGSLAISAKEQDNSIVIEVTDNAGGISDVNIESIFDPFFTTKDSDSALKKAGAGLGLAFCKRIVESHGGTIEVSSQPGEGTTFTITLPSNT